MHFLWNFFLERRAFTILAMVSLIAAGIFAISAIPKESSPEVVIPIGIVTTILPGATASDVEELVTNKLEPAVRNVANIDKVTSSSRQGVSIITAQFIATADIEVAIQDLRNAVESSKRDLPSDAESPTVTKVDFQDQPVLMIGISSDLAPETLLKLSEDIKDDLLSLPGVSRVEPSGIRHREITVVANQESLARQGLSVNDLINALRGANASSPAGTIIVDNIEYPVQFNGSIVSVEDVANTPIRTGSGHIKIIDVAEVIDGYEKTATVSRLAKKDGESSYAMNLNIYKASGGNILAVSETVKERLRELENSLLLGSEYIIVYDAGEEVEKSISELINAGRDTVLLIMLVLFVTIGFREALVSALAIPFSFTIAFIGMWATGNTINFISLFALIIAIGILVDSGIVVVEAIHTNREKGMDKVTAAKTAIKQFAWPLIAGTMTTVAVFVPLFFLTGIIGQFIKSIPFTIVVVLLASIVVALGFVPLLALWILKHGESRFALLREKLWDNLTNWYRLRLDWLFNNRQAQKGFFAFLVVSFVIALALPITGLLQVSMFPAADQDIMYVEVELPQASTLGQTDEVVREVEKILSSEPSINSYLTTIGSGSAFGSGGASGAKAGNITINLDPERNSRETSMLIAERLRNSMSHLQGMNGGKITIAELAGGPPSGAPIVIKVWNDDADALALATIELEKLINQVDGTRDVYSSLSNDGTELAIEINREKLGEYGLATFDIASTLRTAIAGSEATKIRINGEDVAVRIVANLNQDYESSDDVTMTDADAIARIPVNTARGIVPLGSFITISANRSSSSIEHEDGMKIGTVGSYVKDGANAVEVTNKIRTSAETLSLPAGTKITYGGDDEEIKRTFTEMLLALVAGLALMFAMLVLEFNTFRTTLRLLLAIPLSLTGVLIGLFLMGEALSLTAFLGMIALAGVIINHGILLLDVLNHRKADSLDAKKIVIDAASSRLRPIVLTTITTVIGMIPLTLVSEMWAPLAYTIAFGLLYGTILTLVLIPLLSFRHLNKTLAK